MANVGKVVAQLGSANNENTIALANANFNFSLVRLESPKEYAGLGAALTQARREGAETGTAHMTARKLGALFEQVIEPATELFKAYGRRVSNISKSKLANLGSSSGRGLFERHVGPDGTAIWAAATSGKAALAISLLASLLARLWSGPEAISMVKPVILPLYMLQCKRSRGKSLRRDASARAWLRTADEVKKREQMRLRLIMNNLNISVDNKVDVYRSVVRAWQTAMQVMEKLIQGMPQRVQNGAILLAMSAWHLYPDMVVLGSEEKLVRQQDPLIAAGGCLTVGLESALSHHGNDGVYWSLSLAHLRFYGDPILAHRSVGNDASRVNFRSFTLVALGAFLRSWCIQSHNLLAGAELINALWERLNHEAQSVLAESQQDVGDWGLREFFECTNSWLATLAHAAGDLLGSQGAGREEMQLLIQAGARHGSAFLGSEPKITPAFGLCNASNWLYWSEDIEQRITLLRSLAKRRQWDDKELIIRYYNKASEEFDLATVFPISKPSNKRHQDGTKARVTSHERWISTRSVDEKFSDRYCRCRKGRCMSNPCSCRTGGFLCSFQCHPNASTNACGNCNKACREQGLEAAKLKTPSEKHNEIDGRHIRTTFDQESFSWYNAPPPFGATGPIGDTENLEPSLNKNREISSTEVLDAASCEEPITPPWMSLMDVEKDFLEFDLWADHRTTTMHRLIGDVNLAAIYVVDRMATTKQQAQVEELELQDVTEMLRTDRIHPQKLIKHIVSDWPFSQKPEYLRSLKAFAAAANTYKLLPNATVELKTISQTIGVQRWVPELSSYEIAMENISVSAKVYKRALEAFNLSRAQTLACLAMFETGTMNIRPSVLENVMAIATGNSIYVPTSLVCDPLEAPQQHELTRIIGNIGRPGVAMLFPPENLRIREPSIGNWRVVNHKDFDGESKNSFSSTSLHLSFTGYDLPVDDVTTHGAQDVEAHLIEAVVSVHEHGKWVADIDILAALQDPNFRRLPSTHCSHDRAAALPFRATAIDNWDEYLDRPTNACVFRAQDNKLVRLAAAAVGVQRGKCTVVAKDSICAQCVVDASAGEVTIKDFSDTNFVL